LQAWLNTHADSFRRPARFTLRQIYFSIDESEAAAEQTAIDVLGQLTSGEKTVDLETAGSRSLLPAVLENTSRTDMQSTFGGDFATAVAQLEPGRWSGPVASGYGIHLVRLDSRVEGSVPALDDIRTSVAYEWSAARKTRAKEILYEQLASNYTIVIEQPAESSSP
jgi:hypothetical protein